MFVTLLAHHAQSVCHLTAYALNSHLIVNTVLAIHTVCSSVYIYVEEVLAFSSRRQQKSLTSCRNARNITS
jgi:hypothetical protein